MRKIEFTTTGWRGILGEDFTFNNVRIITQAICNVLRKQETYADNFPPRFIIGYDNRFLGSKFAEVVGEVIINNGFDAYISKIPGPTPVIATNVKEMVMSGAIVITASDLAAEYNGIKFITGRTLAISDDLANKVSEECSKISSKLPDLPITPGEIYYFDPEKIYYEQIKRLINIDSIVNKNIDINVDYLYGVCQGIYNKIFIPYNKIIREIHNENRMDFKGMIPSINPENLIHIRQLVINPRASLQIGLVLDGEGANLQVIDASGNIVSHDDLFGLLIDYLVTKKDWKGAIVKPKKLGNFCVNVAKYHNLPVIEVKDNNINLIGEEMRLKDSLIGSDLKGGYIIKNHIFERDAILTGLLVLEILGTYQQNINILIDNIKNKIKNEK